MSESNKSETSSFIGSNNSHHPVGKVEIAGEGGEFVIINKHKYYRHDLMAAFGGNLQPGAAPYPTVNINPAPLGLCGFALTTFVLSLYNAQAMSIKIPNVVVSLACFYGGAAQFLAGLMEFLSGNTFGFTALTSYGAFWLSFAAIFIESFGIGAAYTGFEEQLPNALGFYLMGWAIFTMLLWLNTFKATVPFSALFFFLFVTFLLLAGGEFSGKTGVSRAGGVFGVITAFIAWWNAYAGVATPQNSYFQVLYIPMPGNQMKP
ncbi:uncharacterized protein J8A68_001698 [[Candida] subhashii]|uniref:Ammonia transport outward protein 2 n=1 Tax=[Candida] subhashii TaxID=561895 RepID=A0A8J5UJP6_9ASCO|nr:uncharacterized protein J8A68_001698 [[Candida] subhashii]KAG7664743.1 hypothetical protein J8A68_001698 [[Candida] subhashii]